MEQSLHPTIEALQLAEIASLNNRIYRTLGSSIIVPKKDKIELIPTRNDYHTISIDNSIYSFRNIEKIEYQIDHHKIHFVATPCHTSFGIVLKMPLLVRWTNEVSFIADEHVKVKTFLKKHEVSKGLLAKIKFRGGDIRVNGIRRMQPISLDIGDEVVIDIPPEEGFETLEAIRLSARYSI